MNILDEIAEFTKGRIEKEIARVPKGEMVRRAEGFAGKLPPFAFETALKNKEINFICEVKKASPSKGIIAENFPYINIAREYEAAGAACISCLTEPKYFKGSDNYLTDIKQNVNIPVLRKDFTINDYMVYQAKALGADCILLICSLLDEGTLKEYIGICDSLGMSALAEAHNEAEINAAVNAGARIIGVNNRDLKTFKVDISHSARLRKLVPENILFVAESGIKTPEDIKSLKNANVNGVLIGETLMKSDDKKSMLNHLKGMC